MTRFASLALAALAAFVVNAAAAQVRIGLMVSATGPTSAIGIPQKNTGDLLPRKIGNLTVEYIQLDDGGDTTRAVQNAKRLLQEHNIDALIGPSTTPNALAILDLIAEAKVPMMATVGTSSVVEPLDAKRRWVYKTTQNDDLIAAALLKHMNRSGVKTVGFIGFNDPYGENWLKVFGGLGIRPVRGSVVGDLYCHVAVETPVRLTTRQKELLREFEAINLKDPAAHTPRAKSFFDRVKEFFGS